MADLNTVTYASTLTFEVDNTNGFLEFMPADLPASSPVNIDISSTVHITPVNIDMLKTRVVASAGLSEGSPTGDSFNHFTSSTVSDTDFFVTRYNKLLSVDDDVYPPYIDPPEVLVTTGVLYVSNSSAPSNPVGQQEYTTPGTYSWTAPSNVTSVCVVCIGGGGGGAGYFGCGGAGGGLAYKNNITVTPGSSYTVTVGSGGSGLGDAQTRSTNSGSISSGNGGTSSFSGVSASGGQHGYGLSTTNPVRPTGGSPSGHDGGGTGGTCEGDYSTASSNYHSSGGGGAGGYSGNGGKGAGSIAGNGTLVNATAGSGGGGGGGGSRIVTTSNSYGGAGGGGVGIYGEGTSGSAGTTDTSQPPGNQVSTSVGGGGGSSGGDGAISTDSTNGTGGDGGAYGGGGGSGHSAGDSSNTIGLGGDGQGGAVRIIWGTGRAFPSTDTTDQTATSAPAASFSSSTALATGTVDTASIYSLTNPIIEMPVGSLRITASAAIVNVSYSNTSTNINTSGDIGTKEFTVDGNTRIVTVRDPGTYYPSFFNSLDTTTSIEILNLAPTIGVFENNGKYFYDTITDANNPNLKGTVVESAGGGGGGSGSSGPVQSWGS